MQVSCCRQHSMVRRRMRSGMGPAPRSAAPPCPWPPARLRPRSAPAQPSVPCQPSVQGGRSTVMSMPINVPASPARSVPCSAVHVQAHGSSPACTKVPEKQCPCMVSLHVLLWSTMQMSCSPKPTGHTALCTWPAGGQAWLLHGMPTGEGRACALEGDCPPAH